MEAPKTIITAADMAGSSDPEVRALGKAILNKTVPSLDYFGFGDPDMESHPKAPTLPTTVVETAARRAAQAGPARDFQA